MDPFVVISFGKKVFRTRVIRHSLNPKWDEKLLFHVRRYESNFNVHFSILDWDKISSNDHIGDVVLPLAELLKNAPKPDEKTGLYPASADGTHDMQEFRLPMIPGQPGIFETGPTIVFKYALHSTFVPLTLIITFRAKYQPYAALRQQFWRQYLKQYDADETGTFSTLEITSMLDSLGSTLSRDTIRQFFSSNGKSHEKDELTLDEVVLALEHEISLPRSEKKTINPDEPGMISGAVTPAISGVATPSFPFEKLDFSGPPRPERQEEVAADITAGRKATVPASIATEPSQQPLGHAIAFALSEPTPQSTPTEEKRSKKSTRESSTSSSSDDADESPVSSVSEDSVERVINVKTCPLCHRPRLTKKGEMDIVTHLALCASQDWNRVDRIVVGNFVTPSQAQRKWFAKIVSKVSTGAYQLGAVIIVAVSCSWCD
jgi:phosphatidylserine decarboxylase